MNEVSVDEAVRAYLQRALQHAGGETALARLLGFQRGKVKGWFDDGSRPVGIYGRDLFAVARATGISLDEYAQMREQPSGLEGQLSILRGQHDELRREFDRFKSEVESGLLAQWLQDRHLSAEGIAQQLRDAREDGPERAQQP